MRDDDDRWSSYSHSLKSSLVVFCFGIGLLAFLIAIDRPQWFHIRPAAGIAKAMALASEPHPQAPSAAAQPAS